MLNLNIWTSCVSCCLWMWQRDVVHLSHTLVGDEYLPIYFKICYILWWEKQNATLFLYKKQQCHPRGGFWQFFTRQVMFVAGTTPASSLYITFIQQINYCFHSRRFGQLQIVSLYTTLLCVKNENNSVCSLSVHE
jgi:hypothetical protein